MSKDHFVPRLIIKNFADSDGNIRFHSKETNEVSSLVPYTSQLQKGNFYSKRTLSQLKDQFPHITPNPIFAGCLSSPLEEALSSCLEMPMGVIISRFQAFNDKRVVLLTEDGKRFIKEYASIQHLRTLSFKRRSIEFNRRFNNFSPGVKKAIVEQEKGRVIVLRSLIKTHRPDLNCHQRFEMERDFKRKMKKNPGLINQLRETVFQEQLDGMLKNAEDEIKKILLHPEKHSADIVDMGKRNGFFKSCSMDSLNVGVILNQTSIPFVLTDTGIVLMSDDPEINVNLEIFIPFHPRILIRISKSSEEVLGADEAFVKNFNRISREDSYDRVYSDSKETLEELV